MLLDKIFYPYYYLFRNDRLTITNEDGDTVAGPYCGRLRKVKNFESESNFAGVYFRSNRSTRKPGFFIKYTCI